MKTIAPSVYSLYSVKLTSITHLDDSGEECRYCQEFDSYVEVQAYSSNVETGEAVMVSSCVACLGMALLLADADPLEPLTVEYESSNPVGASNGTSVGDAAAAAFLNACAS